MTKSTWGGRREGAGSGGPRPGAGRPRVRGPEFKYGEILVFEREEIGGEIQAPQLALVIGVADDELELQIDDEIIVIRRGLLDNEAQYQFNE